MLKNTLTVAVRQLRRHPLFSSLNVLGLTIGMASCLLIVLYVADEFSYDRFHEHAGEIYRINWDYSWNGEEGVGPGTPPPLAQAMVEHLPEVESATRLYSVPESVVRYEDVTFTESTVVGADPNFFDFFSFELAEGGPETALSLPNSVILTAETAQRYFGDEPALGKMIQIGEDSEANGRTYTSLFRVTGVFAPDQPKSHIDFDLVTSMASHPTVEYFDWSWIWMQMATYVRVPESFEAAQVEERVRPVVEAFAPSAFERIGFSYEDLIESGGRWEFVLQPLTKVYAGSQNIGNRVGPTSNGTYLYLLLVVAFIIVLIACINFMNLSTARYTLRAREVGVRKALGSLRSQLVGQFLTEAVVLSTIAMALSVGLAGVLLEPFGQLTGKSFDLSLLDVPLMALLMSGFALVVGGVAGSYPSVVLSGFDPIAAIKGNLTSGRGSVRLRNGLIFAQFAISITLITCTLVINKQVDFFTQADLGFERDHVLVIANHNDRLGNQAASFVEALENHASILQTTWTNGVPFSQAFQDYYKVEGRGEEQYDLVSYTVDEDFIETMGLDVVLGQSFSREQPSTFQGVLLNEQAVAMFDLEDPIGKIVTYPSAGEFQVIGVVEDFHFQSMHQPIGPFALFHRSMEPYTVAEDYVIARVRPGEVKGALEHIEVQWEAFASGAPFEYLFLDEHIDAQYHTEKRLGAIFTIFAVLAILIACLGLLGLAIHAAERRTKEVGIRKALGASESGLVVLLVRDFTRWVLLANFVAWPVAWIVMDAWLQQFAYTVQPGVGAFLAAGALVFVLAVATVGYQALKAVRSNPVDSLRHE